MLLNSSACIEDERAVYPRVYVDSIRPNANFNSMR